MNILDIAQNSVSAGAGQIDIALRADTADAHAALDAAVGPLSDLDAYRRYLRGLHAFRVTAEGHLAGAAWEPTALAGLIEADMDDLGTTPAEVVRFDPGTGASAAGVAADAARATVGAAGGGSACATDGATGSTTVPSAVARRCATSLTSHS